MESEPSGVFTERVMPGKVVYAVVLPTMELSSDVAMAIPVFAPPDTVLLTAKAIVAIPRRAAIPMESPTTSFCRIVLVLPLVPKTRH